MQRILFQNYEKCDTIHEANKKYAEEEENYEKPSKNAPPYLIWSIFKKQRELKKKANTLKKKLVTESPNLAIQHLLDADRGILQTML